MYKKFNHSILIIKISKFLFYIWLHQWIKFHLPLLIFFSPLYYLSIMSINSRMRLKKYFIVICVSKSLTIIQQRSLPFCMPIQRLVTAVLYAILNSTTYFGIPKASFASHIGKSCMAGWLLWSHHLIERFLNPPRSDAAVRLCRPPPSISRMIDGGYAWRLHRRRSLES